MTVQIERLPRRRTSFLVDAHRFLPSFILAGYGIFIISLFLRNVMQWYINPGYIAPTTFAGAVLIGLAIVGISRRPSEACADGSCCGVDGCGCEGTSPRYWTYGALALPLVLGLVFPPRALATFSATQRGPQIAGLTMIHNAGTVKRVSLSVDTRSFTMQDWVGALSADPNPKDYAGKAVQVSGLVLHDSASMPPGYIMVLRYLITCCIADARPVGLVVKDTSHGALKDNQWIQVTGVMSSASYQGQKIAVVAPKTLTPTKSGNPYIY